MENKIRAIVLFATWATHPKTCISNNNGIYFDNKKAVKINKGFLQDI